jgi:hypothetical protein
VRRLDPWLLAGLTLCGLLLFIVAYGDRIAPHEPVFLLINGPAGTERPLPPGQPFLFGSDAVGRDWPWYLEPMSPVPYGVCAGSVSWTNEIWPIFISG